MGVDYALYDKMRLSRSICIPTLVTDTVTIGELELLIDQTKLAVREVVAMRHKSSIKDGKYYITIRFENEE